MMTESNGTSAAGLQSPSDSGGDNRPPSELSMVEIAQELERVTSRIESKRVEEREARRVYREVADRVEAEVEKIRERARQLVQEQQRRMTSFNGFIGSEAQAAEEQQAAGLARGGTGGSIEVKPVQRRSRGASGAEGPPRTIQDAVLRIWTLEGYDGPLTTDEIAEALPDVGYESKAAPRSLKSTLNQALAKLTRDGQMQKYRIDGSPIDPDETGARARRYMPAQFD